MYNKLSDAIKAANYSFALRKTVAVAGTAATLALMGMTSQVHAQAAAEAEEITVTGIRGALKNAVDIKRNATAIVDAVSAEDVGKLPDSDVGQSLGRIPGITVARSFGQGASVSIRGAAPQMTLVQLNGHSVASTGWFDQVPVDRSFNYSMLPSELIGGMEVYKSSQADLAEGGIGGTVNVKTRKPLDLDSGEAFVGVKAGTGTIADDITPELSGLYSWKNEGETFGILVAGATVEGDYIRRGDETDVGWSSAVVPSTFIQERERTALNVTAQFKPTENLEFGAQILTMKLVGDNTNNGLYLFAGATPWGLSNGAVCGHTNSNGVCDKYTVPSKIATGGWGSDTSLFGQTWGRKAEMTSDSYDFNAAYTGDGFKATASIGKTESDGGSALTLNYSYFNGVAGFNMPHFTGTVDATGKQIKITPTSDLNQSLNNYAKSLNPEGWAVQRGPVSDEESYGQFDIDFDLDLGAIKSFKVGVRTTDNDLVKEGYKGILKDNMTPTAATELFGGSIELGNEGYKAPKPKLDAMVNAVMGGLDRWIYQRSAYKALNEKNNSVYGMFTFEAEGVKGNFGLRYVETEATSSSYKIDGTPLATGDFDGDKYYSKSRSNDKASYHDVLPSVNVSFDLTDELVLRATASQAINRPSYDNMFTAATQVGYQDTIAGNETLVTGNVGLKPMKSSQADLGLEYYYGDGNLVSVTYFVKDISNFVTSSNSFHQSIGLVSPDSKKDDWTVTKYVNAGGGEIDGLELQWNHAFGNGFGTSINYTYANGTAPAVSYADNINVFTESSKNSANLVGYWENDTFSARAAYNWRSKYMVREMPFYYGNRWHDAFGTLDLSFGWHVTENINVTLEATNVLEEDDIQYGAADKSTGLKKDLYAGYPAWSFKGEARYVLGANFKF
ncbi:TonB-dependent receptor [Cellvibrio zantedeschiae]|uniref:TonB-dependent receptor n=1 Tax=Cellvibrio zantedeschiae TaxID=1237077 RepID=A0ABQ3AS98_9GAMM|nr:TonB-dependent receptor [Cellvibrio zantedeschiae]GGY62383.1 TonB-dependent receptor [Cellvibrio zantedeschiae]